MLQSTPRHASVLTVNFRGATPGASLASVSSANPPIDAPHELSPDLHQDHPPGRLVIAPPPLDPISELAAIERSGRGHRRPKRTRFRAAKSATAMCVCAGVLISGAAVFLGRGPISDYLFASTSARTPSALSAAGALGPTAGVVVKAIAPQASPSLPINTPSPSHKTAPDSELFLPASMVAIQPSDLPKPRVAHPTAQQAAVPPPSSPHIEKDSNPDPAPGALFTHVPNN